MTARPKRRHWRDKDRRAHRAADLRGHGLSLREIAAELVVSHETVRQDLRRWDAAHANVVPLSRTAVKNRPPADRNLTAELDTPARFGGIPW